MPNPTKGELDPTERELLSVFKNKPYKAYSVHDLLHHDKVAPLDDAVKSGEELQKRLNHLIELNLLKKRVTYVYYESTL